MPMESRQRDSIMIRLAEESDSEQIWSIFHAIVKEGDTYAFDPATTKEQGNVVRKPYTDLCCCGRGKG